MVSHGNSTNQCSGRNVAIGGREATRERRGGLGRKDVHLHLSALYFFPFCRETVFVRERTSDSRRTKGKMQECAGTLTSLFRDALISVGPSRAAETEKETRDIEWNTRR